MIAVKSINHIPKSEDDPRTKTAQKKAKGKVGQKKEGRPQKEET
jgi:hypothetical protein